jgi:hypothetical protein
MVKKALIIAAVLALAGCAHSPVPLGIPCDVFEANGKAGFEPDRGASTRWTTGEKEQLIVLNKTGERFCQWKPPT